MNSGTKDKRREKRESTHEKNRSGGHSGDRKSAAKPRRNSERRKPSTRKEEKKPNQSKSSPSRHHSSPSSYPKGTYFSKERTRAPSGPPPGYPTPGSKPYKLATVPSSTLEALSKIGGGGKKAGKVLGFALDLAAELL